MLKVEMHHDRQADINGFPVFQTRPSASGKIWTFICDCGRQHSHGAGDGHRIAHCERHKATGYLLMAPQEALA